MLVDAVQCLDDMTALALVSGRLGAADLARVDGHLDTCDDCRALVVTLAQGSGSGAGEAAEIGVLRSGTRVGRYVISDVVGGGAMGIVYAARDVELDRRVALKLLHADGDRGAAEARERLLGEAQAMARLQHPNVVTVYEVGTAFDRVFLAMELVEGTTLRAWMDGGRAWREVCDVMEQVGKGLAAAHAAGLVHRDVKPDNIMIGSDGRARIGDFGLARGAIGGGVDDGAPLDAPLSRTGTLAGTPAYMSPEALRGEVAGAHSDQFSFCATFFEALHGERPFAGGTVIEMRDAITRGRIAPGRRPAPAWLMAILRRGLSPRSDARFPSMAALLEAIAARRRGRGRHWILAAVAGAVAIAAAASILMRREAARPSCDDGAARAASVWNDAARARVTAALSPDGGSAASPAALGLDRWARGWAAAHDETCRATHVRGDQSALLLDLRMRCLERRRREVGVLVERLARGEGQAARRPVDAVMALPDPEECRDLDAAGVDPLPRDPLAAGAAERALSGLADARAALFVGDHRQALLLAHDLADAAARSGHAPTQAEVELVRAEAMRMGGDGRGAEDAAQASLWAAERGHDDVAAARAWLLLIALAGERRDLPAAEERARHAEAALARAGNPGALVARLDHARGLIAEGLGHLDDAERRLTAALARRRALHGDDDLEVARSLAALGGVTRARGRLDDARRQIEAALAIDERRLGDDHPDVARDLHNLGGVARMAGDLDGALRHYTRALAIRRAALGDDHVDAALTRNSIALVWMARGRFDDAEAELTAALAVLGRARHGDRAIAQHNLGLVAQRRGDHAAALRLFAEAEAVYGATLGEDAEPLTRLRADREASQRAVTARAAPAPGGHARPSAAQPPAAGVYGAPRPWDRN